MDKEQKAIARLKEAALMSETYYQKPLVVTTSGGKDSDVCIALALAAGIDFEVQHNHTTADAPETVYHVRDTFRRLEDKGIKCSVNWPTYKGAPVTLWSLIPQKLMPPTRVARYCCSILKEGGGKGRMITTGVRWAESVSRRNKRGIFESMPHDLSKKVIINNDNTNTRLLFENCKLQAKRVCNPIVDWSDYDVWSYIHAEKYWSIRFIPADFTASAVSVVRWLGAGCGILNLLGIPHISVLISGHLIGWWKSEKLGSCHATGRQGKMLSTGGWRTACCRGRLNWRRWKDE